MYRAVDGIEKYILTSSGRDEGEQALAAELDETGTRQIVESAYRMFRQLNPTMLQLCTDWQIVPADYLLAAHQLATRQLLEPQRPEHPPTTSKQTVSQPATAKQTVSQPATVKQTVSQPPTPQQAPSEPAASQQAPSEPAPPAGRRLNDHTDPSYDATVLERLTALNDQLAAVLTLLSEVLDRYSNYRRRFDTAIDRLAAGELDYFTKPIISSYHTIWFELHEDLLATLNLNRANETANETAQTPNTQKLSTEKHSTQTPNTEKSSAQEHNRGSNGTS